MTNEKSTSAAAARPSFIQIKLIHALAPLHETDGESKD